MMNLENNAYAGQQGVNEILASLHRDRLVEQKLEFE
jgi:hypothetical protein